MSVNSDSGSDDVKPCILTERGDDDVCRDFLRNVCRRGRRCKYRHTSGEDAVRAKENGVGTQSDMGTTAKPELTFCHDFQNTGCHRPTCKFLHCTREEEELYHRTGQLPQRVQQQTPVSGGVSSDIPVCRDYMKGECKRGAKCKYRHVNNNNSHNNHNNHHDYDGDGMHRSDMHQGPGRPDMRHDLRHNELRTNNNSHSFNNFEDGYDKFDRFEYGPGQSHGPDGAAKRRRLDMDGGYNSYDSRYGPGPGPTVRSVTVSYQYQVLEEENTALRRRVEELKKQVADLTATNEVLLEQNARLRVSKSTAVSAVQVPVSQPLPPAVTLTLTSMGQPPPLQATALGAHLSHTSLTQQIALNSDMATQHALQSAAQRMAREIQQQQAAAAAVPPRPPGAPPSLGGPSLNPTVTLNTPLASLALPQNNLVAVSLPSLVTPTPLQQVPGGSMAQTLGPPSNPLVSYPIMSQDMRCAVAPSSLAH